MIVDRQLAERINALMLDASGALNEAAALIAGSDCTEEDKRRLFLAIGTALGAIGTEVLNEIYRLHPALKPADYMLPEDFAKER